MLYNEELHTVSYLLYNFKRPALCNDPSYKENLFGRFVVIFERNILNIHSFLCGHCCALNRQKDNYWNISGWSCEQYHLASQVQLTASQRQHCTPPFLLLQSSTSFLTLSHITVFLLLFLGLAFFAHLLLFLLHFSSSSSLVPSTLL